MINFSVQNQEEVRVRWNDAVLYGPKNKVDRLTAMETIGILEKEDGDFIIIRSPKNIRRADNTFHPEKNPMFYFIPRGMIEKIEPV
ncbi:MAG TPA: hypothetical protein PLW99_02480 [Candidatus Paceibacterota bacterium]|nr:hypothetical protein [Candidatus Paceibacterota bacterium]